MRNSGKGKEGRKEGCQEQERNELMYVRIGYHFLAHSLCLKKLGKHGQKQTRFHLQLAPVVSVVVLMPSL